VTAVTDAGHTWMAPSCTGLSFVYDGMTSTEAKAGDGVNTIEWVSDWIERGFDPKGAGATDVQYVKKNGTWVIAEADVYLNGQFQWTAQNDPGASLRDVRTALTHELGHVLGLLHPCEIGGASGAPDCSTSPAFASACMYPIYNSKQLQISSDDTAGLCFLYPGPRCGTSGCPADSVCTERGCQPLCQGQLCTGQEVCTPLGCRPHIDCSNGCVGQSCGSDGDCGTPEHCVNGFCARGGTLLGQLCSAATDCFDGACIAGACARACLHISDCPSGQTCGESHSCVGSLRSFGASCQSADQCADGLCVTGAADEPICTRACGGTHPACPSLWSCETASGQQVCAPQTLHAAGGCAIARRTQKNFLPLQLLLALVFALRRRRPNERSESK
jgi:hypothetical protein